MSAIYTNQILPIYVTVLSEHKNEDMAINPQITKMYDMETEYLEHIEKRLHRIPGIIKGTKAIVQSSIFDPSIDLSVVYHLYEEPGQT